MSLHRLSAGAGYSYLTRHTACGDVARAAATPLTAYYTEAGYPPGRWFGSGLAGLGEGCGLPGGSPVSEEQMGALYGAGRDPLTGEPLGRPYLVFAPLAERIATKVAALPDDLEPARRAEQIDAIEKDERRRRTPGAVAGFDLTFTVPKSASVLWALGEPPVQAAVAAAHRDAVHDALGFLQERALFTRTGAAGCAQVPTAGMIAACFDHWDTRAGDPNLHTHVVLANKVQGPDGAWRSIDSRALHHATVAVSELYDDLLADHLATALPVRWGWRSRGARRNPAFEMDGIDDPLLAAFSTRSADIDTAMRETLIDFHAARGRGPTRAEVIRLRQQVTRATRPAKTARPLSVLLTRWREHATRLTGRSPQAIAGQALRTRGRPLRAGQVCPTVIDRLVEHTLRAVMDRRSVWTPWNVLTEAARATRGLRMASTADRFALLDQVAAAVLAASTPLDPPDPLVVPQAYRRADGTSVFTRPGQDAYSHPRILDAEHRLLEANTTTGAPVVPEHLAHRIATTPQPNTQPVAGSGAARQVRLAEDQISAVTAIATSGRHLDVLVGPAGTGKTTTLRALRAAWETTHGRGSVTGLAPSATSAHELATSLGIGCENSAKWLHETSGPGATQRAGILDGLASRRATAVARGDTTAVRRIDTARAGLQREQRRWALRPGQLLVVDEASLAGTLVLDQLRAQTVGAGAKLLLVGDHHQLSAVDAGGAFALLADHGTSTELRSLWRFTHRWEAWATRQLRHGDPDVITEYERHGRIHIGPAETMLEAAYTAWQDDEQAGHAAVLVAADTHTVQALNDRAHADRVTAGTVHPDGIPLGPGGERGQVGVGDHILTRRNDRRLAVPGHGHVRNGNLWTVVATNADGSLTVSPTDRHPTPGHQPDVARVVTLPAAYVAEHVDLGYATTIHRAQGLTVAACHVLAAPGMTRQALYVAMTRGRDTNTMYVATDAIDPDCDHLPDLHGEPGGRDILARILATNGAETSATHTQRRRREDATSLKVLLPIRETLAAHADVQRWAPQLTACGLTGDQATRVLTSPARGALLAALREGETLGHPMPRVLAQLVHARPLDDPDDPARDVAAVLHQRVDHWLEAAPSLHTPGPAPLHVITGVPLTQTDAADPTLDSIARIDALIAQRVDALTDAAIATRPTWLRPLDGELSGPEDQAAWREHVAVLTAYRDLTGTDSPIPLGAEPGGDDKGRRRRRTAWHAATQAHHLTHPHRDRSPAR